MEQKDDFKLQLKSMHPGEMTYVFHPGKKFFADLESNDIIDADLEVTLTVNHKGDIYDLNFKIAGTVTTTCDRCLEPMQVGVDTTYDIAVEYGDSYNDESDTLLVIPESDNYLDVSQLIYDTVELALPIKHVHDDGQCDADMSNILNSHLAADDTAEIDPRWEQLKKLSDNNDNNQSEENK